MRCNVLGTLRRTLVVLLGVLAFLALSAATASADVSFNVQGKWTCNNRGKVIPIAGARVELWRDISYWPDDEIGAIHTAGDGSFNFGVRAGSNFDLYVKLILTDDRGAHLGEWYSFSDWDTDTSTVGSHTGVVQLGTWQISKDNGSGTPKCAIWQGAHNAYANYRQVIGSNPPEGSYAINADFPCCGTPFTTRDNTRWPSGYQTGYSSDPDGGFSVNFHEFAHSVRHSYDGSFSHFLFDVARFSYAQNHTLCKLTNEGFAFNEGWAEYWAHTPATCGDGTNFSQEGNVATALTGLESCANRATMVRVLRENPGTIHSYNEFKTKFFNIVGPRACLISTITGITDVEPSFSAAQLTGQVQSQITAVQQLIARLSRQAVRARTFARNPGICSTTGQCVAGLENLIEPSALTAQLAQARLVLSRLQGGLRAAQAVNFLPDFAQRNLYDALISDRRTFDRANQLIVINGLKQSVRTINSEPGFGRARSTTAFRTLNSRLSLLTRLRTRGAAIPSSLTTLFSTPEPPIDATRRVVRTR